jgi:prevent-host-death family protein
MGVRLRACTSPCTLCGMAKQYSIADARRNLPTVVDEVAAGSEVQLTRRGRPVAVVVSIEEYDRLKAQRTTFGEAYKAFRRKFPEAGGGISSRHFRSVRDRGRGRPVDL